MAEAALVSGLGIASHIGADVITAYGTALFHPLSARRFSLGSSFVIDALFTGILLVGLGWSLRSRRRLPAVVGLAVLCLYVAGQFGLQRRAIEIGRASAQAQGQHIDTMSAWAQPFSPFNWKLVGTDGTPRWHLLAVHCCPPHGTRVCTATDIHALRQREERLRSRHAIQPTCST